MESGDGPRSVLCVLGMLYSEGFPVEEVLAEMAHGWGEVFLKSPVVPFSHSTYYREEMGESLYRQWAAFEKPWPPDSLPTLKRRAIVLEGRYRDERGGRRINLDPGLLSLHNLVLASTKDFAHRLYLGQGIFGEVTLIYRQECYHPLEWTYPDYRDEAALDFFIKAREKLKRSQY